MNNEPVTLDVRDEIRNGREPFSKIMRTARGLGPGQKLLLVAPFEPVPLFGVLNKHGFAHDARRVENGDWEVLFTLAGAKSEGKDNSSEAQANLENINPLPPGSEGMQFVDARGLEPPLPMVKILEALADLPEGAGLRAQTDRRPMHLYAQLEARGFIGKSEEQNDGSFITYIQARLCIKADGA